MKIKEQASKFVEEFGTDIALSLIIALFLGMTAGGGFFLGTLTWRALH